MDPRGETDWKSDLQNRKLDGNGRVHGPELDPGLDLGLDQVGGVAA